MPKISISVPDDVLKFIDNLGRNRSGTIVTILKEYKQKKDLELLKKQYEEYAKFCENVDKELKNDWDSATASDIGKDL
ncbi:MAG: hypothetical protein AB1782_00565 [Cyanobacteriota bacterium]